MGATSIHQPSAERHATNIEELTLRSALDLLTAAEHEVRCLRRSLQAHQYARVVERSHVARTLLGAVGDAAGVAEARTKDLSGERR